MYNEEDYLLLSGIQHFSFCRRQWALIHIEEQWSENYRTADGRILHNNAHDAFFTEKRKDVIITRAMPVYSSEMGISGECDVVEFRSSNDGITLFGTDGKFSVVPVEYKRGSPKENNSDVLQLVAQAMCLEEMLLCTINTAYLYYNEIRRREKVSISDDLRENVRCAFLEMHDMYKRRYTPKVRRTKACNACSLKDICLPALNRNISVNDYIQIRITE